MNVALFASAFHPHVGGVEELVRQLAHAYQDAGHQVIVVTERWPRDLPEFERYEDIPLYRVPMRVPTGHWKANLSYAVSRLFLLARIGRIIRDFKADVLHVQCVSSSTLYALHVKQTQAIPLVVTLQGELSMDANGIYQRKGIAQRIMHRALAEADAITACSQQTLAEAEAFQGTPFGSRGQVIPNGIRLADFDGVSPSPHSRPYVLALGRHVRQKGFDILLDAFAQSGDQGHDLILAGDGPEHAALQETAKRLNLSERVFFPGRADRKTTISLFQGCALFVLPSRHEPFGIVNLEAMAAGKPVLATAVGGVPEIIEDGVTGLLVPPEAGPMAARMAALLQCPEQRTALGAAAALHACSFDWAVLAARYEQVLQETCRSASCLKTSTETA